MEALKKAGGNADRVSREVTILLPPVCLDEYPTDRRRISYFFQRPCRLQ
jgi:hypothetical protein